MAYRYLMIKHYLHPSKEHKTEMKDWGRKGKKSIEEWIEFSQKISNKNLTEATYIFDIKEKKMVKNRYRDHEDVKKTVSDYKVIEYLLKKHKSNMLQIGWKEEELTI